jgi:putative hydrolase of the HAD superfamily
MRSLLFDFGEVICEPQPVDVVAAMASLLDLDVTEFRERYWEHRPSYDRGGTARTFWCSVAGHELDDDQVLDRLIDLDIESWSRFNDQTVELLVDARERGHSLSLLSNAPREFAAAMAGHPVLADFDHVIFSACIGVVKPDLGAFHAAVERLSRPPEEILFIDDRTANVDAARAAGLRAVQFTSAGQLRAHLQL